MDSHVNSLFPSNQNSRSSKSTNQQQTFKSLFYQPITISLVKEVTPPLRAKMWIATEQL